MSSSSTVTYTSVYTDSEPGRVFWGADEELSDGGPEHPPSPDYVPGPEHPPLPAGSRGGPEEDHADYPANGGDGDDEPFDDDDDDDDTDDEDEEPFEDEDDDEEEEHLAPADSSAIPLSTLFPQLGIQRHLRLMRLHLQMSITRRHKLGCMSDPRHIYVASAAEETIPSPPLPPPPSSLHLPPPVPTSLPLPSSPLPPLPASLSVPPLVDRREDTPEAELPPRKRLCLTTPTSRNEVGESSTAAPRPTRDPKEVVEEVAPTTLEGVNARVTELAAVQEQDTQDIYAVIEDGQDRQTQLSQRVDEALVSREAWAHSVGLSSAVHYELQAYRTHTQMQDYRIASQESLTATLIAQVSLLQGQLSAALGQIQALQARDQTHADDPEGAGSSA
ncbi:hypothetical protein Tco_1405688 [Tanacetum coccineum]